MYEHNDKENDLPALGFNFKKTEKLRPKTDRAAADSTNFVINKAAPKDSTLELIKKKKMYSEAIREKNMSELETKTKKIRPAICKAEDDFRESRNKSILNTSCKFSQKRDHSFSEDGDDKKSVQKQTYKSKIWALDQHKKEKQAKEEGRPNKNKISSKEFQSVKHLKRQMAGLSSINLEEDYSLLSTQHFKVTEDLNHEMTSITSGPQCSRIEACNEDIQMKHEYQPLMCVYSGVVNEAIGPFDEPQKKEIDLLKRQNATFKKQLATFRKDNGSLKRQIDEIKKQLAFAKERNQTLEEQNHHFISRQSEPSFLEEKEQRDEPSGYFYQECLKDGGRCSQIIDYQRGDEKLKEILVNCQNQLFQARNQTKQLQFRNYMLQKKLMDLTQIHKKQTAKEIAVWKERYIKARNENLRLKENRGNFLLEMSISQETEQ